MNDRSRGNAVVEFAFVLPLVFLLGATLLGVAMLALKQIRLNRIAFQLARETVLSSAETPAELQAFATQWLKIRNILNVEPLLSVREIPSRAPLFPRDNKPLRVLDLTLSAEPNLEATAREVFL